MGAARLELLAQAAIGVVVALAAGAHLQGEGGVGPQRQVGLQGQLVLAPALDALLLQDGLAGLAIDHAHVEAGGDGLAVEAAGLDAELTGGADLDALRAGDDEVDLAGAGGVPDLGDLLIPLGGEVVDPVGGGGDLVAGLGDLVVVGADGVAGLEVVAAVPGGRAAEAAGGEEEGGGDGPAAPAAAAARRGGRLRQWHDLGRRLRGGRLEAHGGELVPGGGGQQMLLPTGPLQRRLAGGAADEVVLKRPAVGVVEQAVQVFQHQGLVMVAVVHGSLHPARGGGSRRRSGGRQPPDALSIRGLTPPARQSGLNTGSAPPGVSVGHCASAS